MSDEKLDQILKRLESNEDIQRRLGLIENGLVNQGKRLEAIEHDVAELKTNQQDNRPILETIQTQLNEFRKEQKEANFEMKLAIHKLTKQVEILAADMVDVRAELRFVGERIDRLEKQPA